jgi:deoxyribonuclease V
VETDLLHSWSLSPKEGVELQKRLRGRIISSDQFGEVRTVAGADVAFDRKTNTGYGGIIVFDCQSLEEIDRAGTSGKVTFPYVPGLLSFRETPLLLEAYERLSVQPDLIICDGHGIAHPRRFGFASHLGLLLDLPSIGCAKSKLIGEFEPSEPAAGKYSPLVDGKETIGAVLRTRSQVNPVFVSVGHKVSLPTAIEIVMNCSDGYRIPKPTRLADHFVDELKRHSLQ